MSANKRHHYVLQFYLRNFASDGIRRAINLFLIEKCKTITNASIAGQCYRHHFYGSDGRLEKALSNLESAVAPIVLAAGNDRKLPRRGTPEHLAVMNFLATQIGRTQAKVNEMNQLIHNTAKYILENSEMTSHLNLDGLEIGLKNAAEIGVSDAAILGPILFDLEFKLIILESGGLMTSDNPAVLFNPAYDQISVMYTRGLASRGLQIYLPITPHSALLFYDRQLYKVGQLGRETVCVTEDDIYCLNSIQYLHADLAVYFSRETQKRMIERIDAKYRKMRPTHVGKFEVSQFEYTENGTRELATFTSNRPRIKIHLSCMKQKRRVGRLEPGVRCPNWTTVVRSYGEYLRKGGKMEFDEFFTNHPLRGAVERIF